MKDLHAMVEKFVRAQEQLDEQAVTANFAVDETVLYIAEEIEQPLVGGAQIAAYWQANRRAFFRMKLRHGPISSRSIGTDIAIVWYALHWDVAVHSPHPPGWQTPIGGDVIVSMVAKQRDSAWQILHYTETTLGALPLVKRAYERAVDADFAASLANEAGKQ
jgi:hypothetical protein